MNYLINTTVEITYFSQCTLFKNNNMSFKFKDQNPHKQVTNSLKINLHEPYQCKFEPEQIFVWAE